MRGEKSKTWGKPPPLVETPPHARGKAKWRANEDKATGNTPACAGKSRRARSEMHRQRKHPRMRGEKLSVDGEFAILPETPPHARGKVNAIKFIRRSVRNTPACAGKSNNSSTLQFPLSKHPRMRGEKDQLRDGNHVGAETPPHARGKESSRDHGTDRSRNTPACAGKSTRTSLRSAMARKHPRMRGEKDEGWRRYGSGVETPPHARGKACIYFRL